MKTMRYQLLGRSGLRVSELCLGTMTFGEEWGWGASEEESRKVFDRFVEAGGNFFDTANFYTGGTSERMLGRFIAPDRGRHVVATKYTCNMSPDDPNSGGNHRKSMVQSVEASLRRLGTEYVDLLWVHAWDGMTPVEEVMRALDDMVRAGKVLYVGISDTPAWIVSQANTLADLRGWTRFVALQIEYSLVERTPERDLLPMAQALDMAVAPWGILGAGMLTGKYDRDSDPGEHSRGEWGDGLFTERNFAIVDAIETVARELGVSHAQVATNWLRQSGRAQVIPILGARKLSQLEDNLGCLDFSLSREQVSQLERASATDLGFPHDFLRKDAVHRAVFGNTFHLIDQRNSAPGPALDLQGGAAHEVESG
jgi:aryl-alcohol dehydrogenase-like predicted oxidoreductase